MLLVGCGDRADTDAVSATTVDPLADAEIDVSGDPESDLCFSASVPSLDAVFDRRSFSPPYRYIIDFVSGHPVESLDPGVNSLTLLVGPHPIVVTNGHQSGDAVTWRQTGGGLLVLGLSLFAAPTTIEFELDGEQGVCEFRPDRQSCHLG